MRKSGIILSLWTALLCFPLSSFALGLGEIEVNSYLNQPLKAEIEVVNARPGEIDDLLVSLASRDAFRKAGLDRASDLSKLRFQIEKSEDGEKATILVTTKSAIKEPFLNFLIEADWAKGRLLREYTILLDPPYFAQQPQQAAATPEPATATPITQPAAEQPATQSMDSMAMESEAESQPQPIALTEQTSQPMSEEPETSYSSQTTYTEPAAIEDEIVVTRGDTLWGIASRLKDDEHSMAQVMLALQASNPEAFGQNNINNLKVGAVIRVPDSASFDDWSKQQAYAQVLEQNGLWDDYVARKTGAATAGSPLADSQAPSSEPAAAEDGQLSLLAPGDEDSTTASMTSDDSADVNQVRKQLALAEEELEASRLENQDLKSRVSDLEAQLKKVEELQKIVQITDSSLAQLQQQQASEQESADTVEATDGMIEEQPSDVMIDAAEKMTAEESGQTVDTTEQAVDGMVSEEIADTDMTTQSTEAETVLPTIPEQTTQQETDMVTEDGSQQATASDGMSEDEPAPVDTEETVPAPAPVIVTEAPDSGISDIVPSADGLLGDPIVLGGIAVIVILLLGLLFVRRRKSSEADQGITVEEPTDSLLDEDATPIHVPGGEELGESEQTLSSDSDALVDTASMFAETDLAEEVEEDEFSKTAVISAEEAPQIEADTAAAEEDQDDVLNEVDVYLAYGLYENAEDLLKENLENSPDRADYRAKLLDTYFATKNKDLFVKEAQALKSLGGAADRYWNRVQIMGFELAPENDLFAGAQDSGLSVEDLEFAKPEAADFDIGADEEATDYSNTDFDLSVDTQNFDAIDTSALDGADEGVAETQKMAPVLDDFSETKVDGELELESSVDEELPDDIGDFDLDLGEDDSADIDGLDISAEDAAGNDDEDALNFDLPDDLDLSTGVEELAEDADIIGLDDTVEAPDMEELPDMDDDDIVLEIEDTGGEKDAGEAPVLEQEKQSDFNQTDEIDIADISLDEGVEDTSQTMVIDPEELKAESEEEEVLDVDSSLDLDMSDIDSAQLESGGFTPSEVDELSADDLESMDEDDGDDITEFRPADMTGEFEIPVEDDAHNEVDPDAGLEKTGTFAPGDFGDEELDDIDAMDGMDDIEDLMLPDDVDEVGTKLDLAKAFIDMGDAEGARSSLEEVLAEGTEEQKAEATGLIEQIK